MDRLKQLSMVAFDLFDWLTGCRTGGIEAPRIMVKVEKQNENTVVITWKNPETCGLSDCRYYNTDLEHHKDIFKLIENKLEYNGKTDDIFDVANWPEYDQKVNDFYTSWGLLQ